jgi:hypothetical protein
MPNGMVKPLALVDNRTGHLMLLIDARTLGAEIDSGMPCQLKEDDGRFILNVQAQQQAVLIGPFSKGEADKLRLAHRLTVAAFRDGIVTRAREVNLRETVGI